MSSDTSFPKLRPSNDVKGGASGKGGILSATDMLPTSDGLSLRHFLDRISLTGAIANVWRKTSQAIIFSQHSI